MTRILFRDLTPERIARRLEEIRSDEAFVHGAYWRTVGYVVAWTLVGLVLIAAGLASTSALWGPILFWTGVLGADLGIALTLLRAFLAMER